MNPKHTHRDLQNDIAIIGMAARLPGANSVDAFWDNLVNGRSALRRFSEEEVQQGINQLDHAGMVLATKESHEPTFVKAGYVMDDPDLFDADFFGYIPGEAELIDPQQRQFLEISWTALEHAGYVPDTYPGLIGVYAGQALSRYFLTNIWSNREIMYSPKDLLAGIGSEADYVANRVSYKLNLRGPAINVQTACSTSLTAIHLGCQALLNGETDMALAGGSLINFPDVFGYLYREGSMSSPDGLVRAFDADAKGTVFASSGVAAIVLKRAEDALEDGDTIYGLIAGSAINNDGAEKVGYTAPAIAGQVEVIQQALGLTEFAPESITYIEAHGTGTPLGDPIEISALSQVYGDHDTAKQDAHKQSAYKQSADKQYCAIGSAKTNIGHLAVVAGVAATIKAALSLYHAQIPPSLNFNAPNPRIDFENSPFFVNTQLRDWETTDDTPRRCAISSFGVGGSNAHIVMEQPPAQHSDAHQGEWLIFPLSARSPEALQQARLDLATHLEQQAHINLADVAYTLQVGRKAHKYRLAIVANNASRLIASLRSTENATEGAIEGTTEDATDKNASAKRSFSSNEALAYDQVSGSFSADKPKMPVLMFTGQGSQYINMARDLYQQHPQVTQAMDACFTHLANECDLDLKAVMFADAQTDDLTLAAERLTATDMTQPALFVVEYALASFLKAHGIAWQCSIGHSIGELVAAHFAGVMSLNDALSLVAVRGRLMQALPSGDMLAVTADEADVQTLLDAPSNAQLATQVSIAAINAPGSCVISGTHAAIASVQAQLEQQEISCRMLHTSHAFHSPMMDPILNEFKAAFDSVSLYAPQMPVISNVTGTWLTDEQATSPDYWAAHLRGAVRFADGVEHLLAQQPDIALIEVGPGTTLSTLARRVIGRQRQLNNAVALNMLNTAKDNQAKSADSAAFNDVLVAYKGIAQLWAQGVHFSWKGLQQGERMRIPLPTYPFERKRFWVEPRQQVDGAALPQFGKQADLADWFFSPSWTRSAKCSAPMHTLDADSDAQRVSPPWLLIYGPEQALLAERMRNQLLANDPRVTVVSVIAGDAYAYSGLERASLEGLTHECELYEYQLRVDEKGDWLQLLQALNERQVLTDATDTPAQTTTGVQIVHLLAFDSDIQHTLPEAERIDAQYRHAMQAGFYSPLALAQAIGESGLSLPVKFTFITQQSQEVLGGDLTHPLASVLLGPVKVMPFEYPQIRCRIVDLDTSLAAKDVQRMDINSVIAEAAFTHDSIHESDAAQPDAIELVAHRGHYRWTRDWCAQPLDSNPHTPATTQTNLMKGFVKGGTYFITGGLGGLGLAMAEMLATDYQANLALTGRSLLPDRAQWDAILAGEQADVGASTQQRIQKVRQLEALGAKVLVLKADVTDYYSMAHAVRQTREHFATRINGVIHSAGIAGGGLMQLKTREQSEAVLAPKILGSLILQTLFAEQPLDILIMNSSLFSATGGMGQVDYTAANNVLDAFAYQVSSATDTRALSINWDGWEEIGMAANLFSAQADSQQGAFTPVSGDPLPTAHPLLQCVEQQDDTNRVYHGLVSAQHWVIDEHRIQSQPAMPGTAWIDMAQYIAQDIFADTGSTSVNTAFSDVFFMSPMMFTQRDAQQELHGRIRITATRLDAHTISLMMEAEQAASQWLPHASMRVSLLDNDATPATFDLDAVVAECDRDVRDVSADIAGAEGFLSLGEHWQSHKSVYLGEGSVVNWFELDAALCGDLDDFALHPALLDIATGPSCGHLLETVVADMNDALYLPLSYGEIRVFAPLSSKLFVYGRVDTQASAADQDTLSLDYVIADELGDVLLEVNGFTLKKVGQNQAISAPDARNTRTADDSASSANNPVGVGDTRGILPDEGIAALQRIMQQQITPQVVVSTSHLPTILNEMRQAQQASHSSGSSHERPDLASDYVEPSSKLEQTLAGIFAGVLGIDQVGIQDNFFELGMDSVLGIQIVSQARKFNIQITPEQLFDKQTIAELTEMLPALDDEAERTQAESQAELKTEPQTPAEAALAGDAQATEKDDFADAGLSLDELDNVFDQL